jgi:soluble lytic murein transglycosylase-like protein
VANLLQTRARSAACNRRLFLTVFARWSGSPGTAQPQDRLDQGSRTRWFRHRALLVPALLLVAVAADASVVRLTERDGTRSVTGVAPYPAAALPRPAATSVLAFPPATSEAGFVKRDGTRSVATVGPRRAPTLPRSAPTSATTRTRARATGTVPPVMTSVASNPAPDLSTPGPTPVPGLGPARPTREAQFIERDGTLYVTNVAPAPPGPAVAAAPPAAPAVPDRRVAGAAASTHYQPLIVEIAARHAVPAKLVESVIHVESGFNPRAVSNRGARGLMQLMPATAEQLGVRDIFDARQNIEGGVRHLRWLLDRYGDLRLALAAYNAGEKAVESHGGVPPISETRAYVDQVLRFYGNSERRLPTPRTTAVAAPGGGSLLRHEAPDGTLVYTNLPVRSLSPSTRDLLAGKQDADRDEVPLWPPHLEVVRPQQKETAGL